MNKKYDDYNIEGLILDDAFFRMAKSHFKGEKPDEWKLLLDTYPEKREMIENAYRIINGLRIMEVSVSQDKIKSDYKLLEKKIRARKNKRYLYWISSAAACLILIVSGYYFYEPEEAVSLETGELLSRLADVKSESNDIQLILGENERTFISDDATIQEKEDGTLVVNNEKKIESDEKDADYIQLIVPNGKRSYVELKDGSRIWVNSGTKLLYPSRFDKKKREIYVDGEIYLEVARNESAPFLVHTKDMNVKVLGTSFNVSAYRDEAYSQIVLVSGSVEVDINNKEVAKLTPNTCFHVENDKSDIRQVDVYKYICWKDGIMTLEEEELQSIFRRLSRYYNLDITSSPEIDQVRYSGKLGLDNHIESVLYNISLVEPIGYTREGNTIHIYMVDE